MQEDQLQLHRCFSDNPNLVKPSLVKQTFREGPSFACLLWGEAMRLGIRTQPVLLTDLLKSSPKRGSETLVGRLFHRH